MENKKFTIRLETPNDYNAVEKQTRDAFWGVYSPSCTEHLVVRKLHESNISIPELNYVAEMDGRIVGSILYSRSKVVDANGNDHALISFGPLSVLPEYRSLGIGAALMNKTIEEAQKLGCKAIIIYGEPDYYPRFGFRNAKEYSITTPEGDNFDAFMVLPLFAGALNGISGKCYQGDIFYFPDSDAIEFDKSFPPKEAAVLAPISLLFNHISPAAQEAFTSRKIDTLQRLKMFSGREIASWDGIDENTQRSIDAAFDKIGLPRRIWH